MDSTSDENGKEVVIYCAQSLLFLNSSRCGKFLYTPTHTLFPYYPVQSRMWKSQCINSELINNSTMYYVINYNYRYLTTMPVFIECLTRHSTFIAMCDFRR
jgi:hypothetical protein